MTRGRWRALDLRDELHQQVQARRRRRTATVKRREIAGEGNYYAATVLADVTPGHDCISSGAFGPVAAITVAKMAHAPRAGANDKSLACRRRSFTADDTLAAEMAARLECGGYSLMVTAPARCAWHSAG